MKSGVHFCRLATLLIVLLTPLAGRGAVVPREVFVPSRLGQIHLRLYGPAAPGMRTPILMIHQTGLSGLEYQPLAEILCHDRQIVVVDLPGYGWSDPLATPPTIDGYADAVADAMAALAKSGGPNEIDAIGTHGGSLIAAQMALSHPRLVRRLILVGLAIETPEEQHVHSIAIRRDEPFPATMLRLQAGLADFLAKDPAGKVYPEQVSMLLVDSLRSYTRRWFLFDASTRYPGRQRLSVLVAPTMIVALQDDLRDDTLRAAGWLPHMHLADLAPLGRLPYFHDPKKMADLIMTFFDRP